MDRYEEIEYVVGVPKQLLKLVDELLKSDMLEPTPEHRAHVYTTYNQLSNISLWLVAEKLAPLKGTNPFQHEKETRYFLSKILSSKEVDSILSDYTTDYLNSTFEVRRVYIDGVRIPVSMCAFRKGQIRIEPIKPLSVRASPWLIHEEGIYKVYIGFIPYRFSKTIIKGGDLILVT